MLFYNNVNNEDLTPYMEFSYGCPDSIGATDGYKGTKFQQVRKGVGVAHSTDSISRTTQPWKREGAIPSSRF